MTQRIDSNFIVNARLLASRVLEDNIEQYSADPGACRKCGADFLQGESHARTCPVSLAEEIIITLGHRPTMEV